MLDSAKGSLRPRALIIDDGLGRPDTTLGRATESLAAALAAGGIDIARALSFEDGSAIASSDASISAVLINWDIGADDAATHAKATALLHKLRERHETVPVFLLADRQSARGSITIEVAELIDEFVWLLEDTAAFIAGRVSAAIDRYRAQLLPPYARALARYAALREHSWSAPGHQGGVAFTKLPVGRAFFDFLGENVFRIDMGIERGDLGSLLDHTGPVAQSEQYAARVFGAHRSYSGVVGTSGSNRSIMQACMNEDDLVIVDRNCHKSIEQGLILTGARPVYMLPSRNPYGIIGPIAPTQMEPEALRAQAAASPLSAAFADRKPVYSVLTNCTYDGLCYNAERAQDLLAQSCDRIHFDEAWYAYARFNPMYEHHYAMRGDPALHQGPTVFATHSTHKLLAALSQASYIHVRDGRGAIDHQRFNQAYMMHTTTSPLYAIVASNDITAAMMTGSGGRSLTQEVIQEAVDFRQVAARIERHFADQGDWFFKPWNAETVLDPASGRRFAFAEAPSDLLCTQQQPWVLQPGDAWHGFGDIAADWCMLDPIKVSLLAPGIGPDGQLAQSGVPAAVVSAFLSRIGIVPTRVTDFQLMFLFSIGITKGKWGTLITTLLAFKRHYDANDRVTEVLPEIAAKHSERYANVGLRDLGNEMFEFLRTQRPGELLNRAYETLPTPTLTPRQAYQRLVAGDVETVAVDRLANRTAANAVMPYPPGIPMLMSGESFGGDDSPQIGYLRCLESWDRRFPGFEHVTEGAEVKGGTYHVLCTR